MNHRARPARILRPLAVVLLLLWALIVPAAHAEPERNAEISLDRIDPEILTGDEGLSFRATIYTSEEELTNVTIWWRVYTPALTPESYEAWMAADPELDPITFARHDLTEPVPAGGEQQVNFEIPPESFPFDAGSPTGARGVELVLTATTGEGTRISESTRSTIIWVAPGEAEATPLTVAIPLTPTAAEWRLGLAAGDPAAAQAAPRILSVLDSLDSYDLTWGVDPALLDPTPLGTLSELLPGNAPEDDASDEDEPAATLERELSVDAHRIGATLRRMPGEATLISLGWAAPDHGRRGSDSDASDQLSELNRTYSTKVFNSAGITPETDTAWTLEPLRIGEAARLGEGTAVITPATPGGAHVVPPTAQDVMIHAGHEEFTDLLTSSTSAHELRTLSLIYAQADSHVLATLPADIDAETAEKVAENLNVLADAPWLDLSPLANVDPATSTRQPIRNEPVETALDLSALTADLDILAAIAESTEQPEQFRGLTNTLAFLATSSVWDEGAPEPAALAHTLETAAHAQYVSIERPSDVNLISQGGDLPVGVENHSSVPMSPHVSVEPADARLLVEEQVEVHLDPQSSTTVMVPITAVANGNVETTIHLLNADGVEISMPETFTVRVRADWETTGTAIVAGLIAVAFLFGLVRNVRGRPRRHAGRS